MGDLSCLTAIDTSDLPEYLWRYMKPSFIRGDRCGQLFDLRVNPPEQYVSFFEGEGDCFNGQAISALRAIMDRVRVADNGQLCCLDVETVCRELNNPVPVIEFKPKGRPHFGMFYLIDDEISLAEVKTNLQFLCSGYEYSKTHYKVYTDSPNEIPI